MKHPQAIRKAYYWADEISQSLKLSIAPGPIFVRFVPKHLREEVELELLTRYGYSIISWGEVTLSPGIHHLGPAQLIEFESVVLSSEPESVDEKESQQSDLYLQKLVIGLSFFSTLVTISVASFCVLSILAGDF